MQRSLRFFLDLTMLRKSSFLKQKNPFSSLLAQLANTDMDVIWTAVAVKRIQFEVLNSVLIRPEDLNLRFLF